MKPDIVEAYKTQKMGLIITHKEMPVIIQFIRDYVPNGADRIEEMKHSRNHWRYDGRGEPYWTDSGKEELIYMIIQAKESAVRAAKEQTQFDPLPTGGPDFSRGPQTPAEALELLIITPRLSSKDYAPEALSLLEAIAQSVQHMGADFRELWLKVSNERLRLSYTNQVDWVILEEISDELILIRQSLSEEVETTKSVALKDGSTFAEMSAYIKEAVQDKSLSKAVAGLAHAAYARYENQNKGVALRKMRDILKAEG
jgi:hypothetical protein